MINAQQLLDDLTRQLKRLEDDLRTRIADTPALEAALRAEWQAARDANRCAETFESWAEQAITQSGVHWLLSCVFLRFIEDNQLVDRPWLAGTPESGRLSLARDRHEAYFRAHPLESDRDYLLASFREAGALPGLKGFFDAAHNPVFRLGISGDAAMALRQFWQTVDPATGVLMHDFTDPAWDTRFLGDLYQDLSEATRKRYALLQTPEFVEAFILDRTLTPAIREFGYQTVRMIDPTCGSGHFLLGGFERLVAEWQRREPGRNPRDIAQKALDAVAGVDLNPFAVAIARFRLLVAALKVGDVTRLVDAPNLKLQVAIGDSLLHGPRFGFKETEDMFQSGDDYADTGLAHVFASEDLAEVQKILGRQYHTVVGNPPYIVVKDAALNQAYRRRYVSCHMKYSLGCPFTERFFELAQTGREGEAAGFVGLITANSFMKREFGSRLIEQVLPALDLTHVLDTSGAYIPGHGTPTVILFGRHRPPLADEVRTVMGIKGEPSTPDDPAQGLVWSAIVRQVDVAGSESEFVSTTDTPRSTFGKHPWSIGGGGAAELKEVIEADRTTLASVCDSVGITCFTLEDDVFVNPPSAFSRFGVDESIVRDMVSGDEVRDWNHARIAAALFPYDEDFEPVGLATMLGAHRFMWPYRTDLSNNKMFGKQTKVEAGLLWWEYGRLTTRKLRVPLSITFAEIATHNHFVLDRGGKVFKQTAPVIKLPAEATEDEHLGLLGLLNSSVACFWLKQVCHQKQMMGGDGIRISEKSKVPYQFASTRVQELPLPDGWPDRPLVARLTALAREADELARGVASPSAEEVVESGLAQGDDIKRVWAEVLEARRAARSRQILIQEEIDFTCYALYGLETESSLLCNHDLEVDVTLEAGDRPFCMVKQANVDGFTVPAGVPEIWPGEFRALWSRRIEAIKNNSALRVIEDPHYKRRWIGRQGLFNHDARADEFSNALRAWMLARLESERWWPRSGNEQLSSVNRLADAVRQDAEFMQIAELYSGRADFDVTRLVGELVTAESMPFLPVLRYKDSGLRKRIQWERCWELQRQEDAIDAEVDAGAEARRQALMAILKGDDANKKLDAADLEWVESTLAGEIAKAKTERKLAEVGAIPVPPKYKSTDFVKSDYWRLRGGLDVPKERWVSYPGCERGADGSLPISWAGWDHLQQATALARYYLDMKDTEGWPTERLLPLLTGLLGLLPWLKQWHNELDPDFGERMGDYYDGFVRDEAKALGVTLNELRSWKPAASAARRGRRRVR